MGVGMFIGISNRELKVLKAREDPVAVSNYGISNRELKGRFYFEATRRVEQTASQIEN